MVKLYEELQFIPQDTQKPGMVVHTYTPGDGEGETGGFLGLIGQTTKVIIKLQDSERPCHKKKCRCLGMMPDWNDLCLPHTFSHTCTSLHAHMQPHVQKHTNL